MSNALKGLLWLIIAVVVLAGGYALYAAAAHRRGACGADRRGAGRHHR